MATKPRSFDPDLYYHVYNCGVEKRKTFLNGRDYQRFLDAVAYYLHNQTLSYVQFQDLKKEAKLIYLQLNPEGLKSLRVRILAYCVMPNHFHFLIRSAKERGLPQFVSDITNSYTKYFNIKNKRIGNLFQGTFKAKEITSETSLLQVSRYIHLNPADPYNYPYSSFRNWIDAENINNSKIVDPEEVGVWLKLAGGPEKYRSFVDSKIGKDSSLEIASLILES